MKLDDPWSRSSMFFLSSMLISSATSRMMLVISPGASFDFSLISFLLPVERWLKQPLIISPPRNIAKLSARETALSTRPMSSRSRLAWEISPHSAFDTHLLLETLRKDFDGLVVRESTSSATGVKWQKSPHRMTLSLQRRYSEALSSFSYFLIAILWQDFAKISLDSMEYPSIIGHL